jgi:glycine hydroxymethyltransferase
MPNLKPRVPSPLELLEVATGDPEAVLRTVRRLVKEHGRWNRLSLNLVASHSRMSPAARAFLSSSLATDFLSGELGSRIHSGGAWIDAIDTLVVELCRRVFNARRVEYRPMSGALANGLALFSIARRGQAIMALAPRYGGHYTYREQGYPGRLDLPIADIPYDEDSHSIDLDKLADDVERIRPQLLIVGTAGQLFPYPLHELQAIAATVNAHILYDGAHILGLIAGNQFQDPLAEGATVLTGSTQKTLAGPIGGLIMTNDETLGADIQQTTSNLLGNYHNNRIASLAVTLAEMICFGEEYAAQVVKNARALASGLDRLGMRVIGKERGFTDSHIVLFDPTSLTDGHTAFERLAQAGILTTRFALAGTYPLREGIRVGTPTLTRLGAKEDAMVAIASLIGRVLVDNQPPQLVAMDVAEVASTFSTEHYCF